MKAAFRCALAAFSCAVAVSFPAAATTFGIDYEAAEQASTDDTFDVDCGGAAKDETPDCAERAAALHAELVDLLASLNGESDAETTELFEAVGQMNDPQLQEIALRYFSYHQQASTGFWDKAHEFFFGPDAQVGRASAELLKTSQEELDRQLADAYLEGRPTPNHGGDMPSHRGLDDSWALGYSQDVTLDDVPSFDESELFPNATRLLMLDRYIVDHQALDPDPQGVPVTAFVSDASTEDITAHFKAVFGRDPYPPVSELQARQQAIGDELQKLSQNPSGADFAKRFQELYDELNDNQVALTAAARIGLDDEELSTHVFWADPPASSATIEPMPRAVTLGSDPRVEGNVIRYYNGATSGEASNDGGPSGSAGDGSSEQDPNGEGGAETTSSGKDGSSGCNCSFEAGRGGLAGSSAVLLLAVGLLRRSRSRRARK